MWPLMGLLLLIAVVLAVLGYVFAAPDQKTAITLVSAITTMLVAAGPLAVWLWRRRSAQEVSGSSLDRAADLLAEQVKVQWAVAAGERRLMQPAPIPVRWRWSNLPVTGPLLDAVGEEKGWHRFAPLPELPAVRATALSQGGLRDLLGVYGGLDSGRLVILGAGGAGKTGAAIRLLLDAVAHRAARTDSERPRVPVPVMFTLHGWDPTGQSLVQWLAGRVSRDYPLLGARELGPHAASRLIGNGRVSVILDGLDEMPEDLRPVALRALDEQATFRVVLLTRSHEMVAAAAGGHLSGAAALELQPIPSEDAATYLARCQIEPLPSPWQRLLTCVRNRPDSAVAQALDSPLMLTLVRDTYQPGDRVDELLDPNLFADREAVEDHLLDRVLPAAYATRPGQTPSRYTLAQAQRWLGFIAHRMNQDTNPRDLAWWLIPRWKPAWPRIVVTGLVFGLVFGLGFGLMFGLVGGLGFGLVFGRRVPSPRQVGRLDWRRGFTWRTLVLALVFGLGLGLVSGLGSVLVDGLSYPAADANSPIDPMTCWHRDRWFGLVFGLGFGLVFGLVFGLLFVFGFLGVETLGPGLGLVFGLGLMHSATWPTALTFGQLRCAGECPVRLLRFLEDARRRHVLRIIGPVYQFRHGRLQQRLARPFEKELNVRSGQHHPAGSIHSTSLSPTTTKPHQNELLDTTDN